MDRNAHERRGARRQRRRQRLALPGLHLRDLTVEEHAAAGQLHVTMALPDGAPRGLADDREGACDQLVAEAIMLERRAEGRGQLAQAPVADAANRALRGMRQGQQPRGGRRPSAPPPGERRQHARCGPIEPRGRTRAAFGIGTGVGLQAIEGRSHRWRQTLNCPRKSCRTSRYHCWASGRRPWSKRT